MKLYMLNIPHQTDFPLTLYINNSFNFICIENSVLTLSTKSHYFPRSTLMIGTLQSYKGNSQAG